MFGDFCKVELPSIRTTEAFDTLYLTPTTSAMYAHKRLPTNASRERRRDFHHMCSAWILSLGRDAPAARIEDADASGCNHQLA